MDDNAYPHHQEIEKSSIHIDSESQTIQTASQNKNLSGRSKPPSVLAAFSYAPYPGGYRAIHLPCSGLHPQGFAVSSYPAPYAQRVTHAFALLALQLNRIIAKNRACRFCAIAVTLATHTCVWLRARWVGGLSSAAFRHRRPLSPSHFNIYARSVDKCSADFTDSYVPAVR